MAAAVLKLVETRRDLAERLMALEIKLKSSGLPAQIDELKEQLRKSAEALGKGFIEKFNGGRYVKVSGPGESAFKGLMPVLDPAAFLALPDKRREKLIEDNIVAMQQQFTKASRPSVTVKD
jgi:hypothetical protein